MLKLKCRCENFNRLFSVLKIYFFLLQCSCSSFVLVGGGCSMGLSYGGALWRGGMNVSKQQTYNSCDCRVLYGRFLHCGTGSSHISHRFPLIITLLNVFHSVFRVVRATDRAFWHGMRVLRLLNFAWRARTSTIPLHGHVCHARRQLVVQIRNVHQDRFLVGSVTNNIWERNMNLT